MWAGQPFTPESAAARRTELLADPAYRDAALRGDTGRQQELAGLVARAVAELPEPLRLVLVLRHYESLSFEEIARLTETPASTLKSRFAVALQRLRERLHYLDFDHEDTER